MALLVILTINSDASQEFSSGLPFEEGSLFPSVQSNLKREVGYNFFMLLDEGNYGKDFY